MELQRRVAVVGYDDAELLDIACVTSTLSLANELTARQSYRVQVVTPGGRPVTCSSGLTLGSQQALERLTGRLDTLVISGGPGTRAMVGNNAFVDQVRRAAGRSRRVVSVCTGAIILAATGLLDGRRATTHWEHAHLLAAHFPAVTVDPDPIYLRDGNVFTTAGVTSALDLTLALVEDDHGADVARQVARTLVTYLQRPGNQAQMSMFLTPPPPEHSVVRRVIDHVTAHPDSDLSTATLAALAGVSERHLTRLFVDGLGTSPGRFVRRTRTEAAAHLLTTTPLPVSQIAIRCGFRSPETLRQAFVAHYGIQPSRYRATQTRSSTP
jgi:transcriptional regulator GlxA family with amidase domain